MYEVTINTYSDFFALIVGSSGQGDADGPRAELPVQDDDHDLVRGGAGLFQRLVGLVNQTLKLLLNMNKKII